MISEIEILVNDTTALLGNSIVSFMFSIIGVIMGVFVLVFSIRLLFAMIQKHK